MNILTEKQANERQLNLAADGLFSDLSADFLRELQGIGFFVEYNQQAIIHAGEPVDYLFCIISGQVAVSRTRDDFKKSRVSHLGSGQWFGEISFFLGGAAEEEARAEGEVIVWAIPPDTLRALFFERPETVQLLYNLAVLLAQKISLRAKSEASAKA